MSLPPGARSPPSSPTGMHVRYPNSLPTKFEVLKMVYTEDGGRENEKDGDKKYMELRMLKSKKK